MYSNDQVLALLGRDQPLLQSDIQAHESDLVGLVRRARFLVIGGAGSIGRAVTCEIFKRNPSALHVVDISENSTVELVRNIRSTMGYIDGEFKTFSLDCGDVEFESMVKSHGPYDYVLNLSALKHVRSERDPHTLMRMIKVNILNTLSTIEFTADGLTKYFCVSTDKAANPVNMMGASKRIMEMYLARESTDVNISTARFANVAFSDGSLLDGFNRRLQMRQPIAAPNDITRYFVTAQEAGELCLMSALLGDNLDIFFPNHAQLTPITFSSIAQRLLHQQGFEPIECESEGEARAKVEQLIKQKKWPCFFSGSDTTGEKPCEEFFTENERVDWAQYQNLGIVKNAHQQTVENLTHFLEEIESLRTKGAWDKYEIVKLFESVLPGFSHVDTGKYLDQKM